MSIQLPGSTDAHFNALASQGLLIAHLVVGFPNTSVAMASSLYHAS
jgi:hypothetical protein